MILHTSGVTASAFAFTSLLTIPLFSPVGLYVIAIAAAFFVAMALVVITDYRTPEQKAEALARIAKQRAEGGPKVDILAEEEAQDGFETPAQMDGITAADAAPYLAEQRGTSTAVKERPVASALQSGAVTEVGSPLTGQVVPLKDVPDAGFASGAVGLGAGVDPTVGTVVAPAAGKVVMTFPTGHAVGLKLDSGVELLIHIGIDTVNMEGKGFRVHVSRGDRVEPGTPLVDFDIEAIKAAGYSPVTPVLVTNHKKFASVQARPAGPVAAEEELLRVTAKQ